jgi:hypothetical protein
LREEAAELFVELELMQEWNGVYVSKSEPQRKQQMSTQLGGQQFQSSLLVQVEANTKERGPKKDMPLLRAINLIGNFSQNAIGNS